MGIKKGKRVNPLAIATKKPRVDHWVNDFNRFEVLKGVKVLNCQAINEESID